MGGEIPCPECGSAAISVSGPASMEQYRCIRCGHTFYVRVHYIEEPIPVGVTVYKALIPARTSVEARKNRIKAKKVFSNQSNFYPEDIEDQIAQQKNVWDLGFYSEREVNELREAAAQMGLEVKFVLIPREHVPDSD